MVQPFQLKKVKQILPFLFSHFFPVHGILHEHENRFSFLSYTQEPPLGQPVNKHPWKNEKFGISTNILLKKKKKKTEDVCTSQWQKASSQGGTITKSFYRISTAPQAIAKITPKKSNRANLITKKKTTKRLALEYTYNSCRFRLNSMSRS